MINVTEQTRPTRECTAPYEHRVKGKTVTTEIRVCYYSWTTIEIKKQREEADRKMRALEAAASVDKVASLMADLTNSDGSIKEELSLDYLESLKDKWAEVVYRSTNTDEPLWISEMLAKRLESLPDLIGGDKKPVKITVDFLDTLDIKNLEAISKAIEEDLTPKAPPQT